MVNEALEVNDFNFNGRSPDIHITSDGSSLYFAICAIMGAATLAFLALSLKKTREDRIFYHIMAAITLVSAISYFTKGSNLGWAPIAVQFQRDRVRGFVRQIFYARYIDWVITTPLILLAILLTAATPWQSILWLIFIDEVMVVCGLIGALVSTRYKWGYFTIGTVALLYLLYQLMTHGLRRARVIGSDVSRVYLSAAGLTAFIWLLYPIAWGLSEGGNVIHPDSEAVFYSVLDVLSKVVFGFLLVMGLRNIPGRRMGLHVRDYTGDDAVVHEKGAAPLSTTGVTGTSHV